MKQAKFKLVITEVLLTVIGVAIFILMPNQAVANEKISVAVAANFISAFKEMAADFEAKTKIKVEGTFSSTGNLYSQITNGAPYDLFLSADEERPAKLYKDGAGETPFIYAKGQAVLWPIRISARPKSGRMP